MKNPKYYRTENNICPWCAKPSPKTGNECGHLHKITKEGVYFWYWGIRPCPAEKYGQKINADGGTFIYTPEYICEECANRKMQTTELEAELRALWTAQGVPVERQDAIIAEDEECARLGVTFERRAS